MVDAATRPAKARLWRLTIKSISILSLLMGFSVYSGRVPDSVACVQIASYRYGDSGHFGVVDAQHGAYLPDARTNEGVVGIMAPDGEVMATLEPSRIKSTDPDYVINDLVIRPQIITNPPQSALIVQEGISSKQSGFTLYSRMSWSPDGSKLVYLWADTDHKYHLSSINRDGTGKRDAHFDLQSDPAVNNYNTNNALIVGNWSADGTYFIINETVAQGSARSTVWSVSNWQAVSVVENISLRAGTWSPHEHRLALARRVSPITAVQELVVWSPSGTIFAELPTSINNANYLTNVQSIDVINWSPDGHYLAIQTHRSAPPQSLSAPEWTYDIWKSDGTHITSLVGKDWSNINGGNVYSPRATALWTANSRQFIFMQEHFEGAYLITDLVGYDPVSGETQPLMHNLVSSLASEIYYINPSRQVRPFSYSGSFVEPSGQRLVVPTWQGNKIRIDVMDADGSHVVNLLEGADSVVETNADRFTTSRFWPSNAMIVYAVTTIQDNQGQSHQYLTWMRPDGSDRHQIEADTIRNVRIIGLGRFVSPSSTFKDYPWLAYIAQRNGSINLEIAKIDSGESHILLTTLTSTDDWQITTDPAKQTAAVQIGDSVNNLYSKGQFYLVSLDGKWTHTLDGESASFPRWSPDGTMVAYRYNKGSGMAIKVITTHGTVISDVSIQDLKTQYWIYNWSRCH